MVRSKFSCSIILMKEIQNFGKELTRMNSDFVVKIVLMNRGISWATKDKVQRANYFGSLTQAASIRVGSFNGEEIYAPFKSLLPMVISCFLDF